jgi:MAE_28990/MAE_18760-like HEPN
MEEVIILFNSRKAEVNTYFEYGKEIVGNHAQLLLQDKSIKPFSMDFKHIILANGFLLLYNLVESTFSNAIEAIYKTMLAEGCRYDAIQPNIQKEIIDNVRKNLNTNSFVETVHDIASDILNHYPTPRQLFSGNVDQIEIKRFAQKYGFSFHTDAMTTRNGEPLKTIKNRRNDLAHGFISFKHCGQDRTFSEMENMKNQSLLYIEQILNNMDTFLKNKDYLK